MTVHWQPLLMFWRMTFIKFWRLTVKRHKHFCRYLNPYSFCGRNSEGYKEFCIIDRKCIKECATQHKNSIIFWREMKTLFLIIKSQDRLIWLRLKLRNTTQMRWRIKTKKKSRQEVRIIVLCSFRNSNLGNYFKNFYTFEQLNYLCTYINIFFLKF